MNPFYGVDGTVPPSLPTRNLCKCGPNYSFTIRFSLSLTILYVRSGVCLLRRLFQAMPLKTDDPMQYYTDMKKLGQGASGTVFAGTDVRTGEVRHHTFLRAVFLVSFNTGGSPSVHLFSSCW